MRYAVVAREPNTNGLVSPVFGRCAWLILFDDATGATEVIENPAATASGGAGIQTAQIVLDHDIDVLVAPKLGPKAHEVLTRGGVRFVFLQDISVGEALEAARREDLG